MRLHLEALFRCDEADRLLVVNEPDGGAAPRFFLGRTHEGSAWWFRHDVDRELAAELETLCRSESVRYHTEAVRGSADPFVDRISRRGGVQNVWQGPAFCFPEALSGGGGAVRVTEANAEVLSPRFEDWLGDVSEDVPMAAVLEDGKAVSICCSVRLTSEAHEAGVETHEDFRGRGHGAAATAAWARAVREMDRMPLYSTSWGNYASRALASRLGLIQFGVDLHIT
jgi:hypothetical protein